VLPKYDVINGVKVFRYSCYAPGDAFYFSTELLAMLRAEKFDVVHAHNYHGLPFHVAGIFAKCDKFIVSPCYHGAGHTLMRDCLFKIFKPFGKWTLKKADKVLAASEYEKILLCEDLGLNPDEIVVIPRGVNFSEFKGLNRCRHKFKSVLFVGRLVEYKGVQFLVEALPKLPNNVILKIVGKGPLRNSLEAKAKKLGVLDRVKFFQNLERQQLLRMYAESDVFVLPSKYESYSKVVAEALMAGTPCIVANTSALKEWIDNKTCFGLDYPINVEKLVEIISKVIEGHFDKKLVKEWVGVKIIDWNDVASKLEEIYRE
jgi:glycosyltransferase involved in cell wall biosynthesis